MTDFTSTSDREQMAAYRIQNENRPTTIRATSVYTFYTEDPAALTARLTALDHSAVQIQDQGERSVSIRVRGGDTAVRAIAQVAGHTGRITTGLGIHQRTIGQTVGA